MAFGLELKFDGDHHKIMVTAYVGSRERSGFGFVDAGFEALWVRMKSIWLITSP